MIEKKLNARGGKPGHQSICYFNHKRKKKERRKNIKSFFGVVLDDDVLITYRFSSRKNRIVKCANLRFPVFLTNKKVKYN